MEIFRRIRLLAIEIVARMNSSTRLYLVNALNSSTMDSKVSLVLYDVPGAVKSSVRALLNGQILEKQAAAEMESDRLSIVKEDKAIACQAVEESLRNLRLPQKHIRMRVNFGRLTLSRYRKAEDHGGMYGFGEFRQMIANPNTIGCLRQE